MNITNKSLSFLALGLGLGVFIVCSTLVNDIRENNKIVDILKHVDISRNSHLISPIISELHRFIGKRENRRFLVTGSKTSLSDTFQKLQEAGKATSIEEVEAIKEFEKAISDLSKAIQRLDSIPNLRH